MNADNIEHEIDRNTIDGFARVRTNLDYILAARAKDAEVHVVTELLVSLLGLAVFPVEWYKQRGVRNWDHYKLDDLYQDGWPKWTFHIEPAPETLGSLLEHIRNGASHRRVQFSSDDRELKNVTITFRDRLKPRAPDNWAASISADQLLVFVRKLSTLAEP
jgi:hypothetical protein